jgi:MYXO-CTERM domain-containing protein
VFNNILYDAIVDRAPYSGYGLKPMSGSRGDYNLAFLSAGSRSWGAPIGTDPHSVLNQDPLFGSLPGDVLSLQPGSPARDAGGPLTAVASSDPGSGTSLVVDDAHFFQPGWAGTSADWVAIGAVDRVVEIRAIDYPTNTITLANAVPRAAGDPVWLYKDSSGRVVLYGAAPDIGAFEFADSSSPDGADAGADAGGDAGTDAGGGADADAAATSDEGAASEGADSGPGSTGSGCGCGAAGVHSGVAWLLGLAWLVRRRRKRGPSS